MQGRADSPQRSGEVRAHEVPVSLSWLPQELRAIVKRSERDEFFLAGDLGPSFFGAERVFPSLLFSVSLGEECLACGQQLLVGLLQWKCRRQMRSGWCGYGSVVCRRILSCGAGEGQCCPTESRQSMLMFGQDKG